MIPVLIGIFTFVLILIALFLILIVLMQRAKSDSGMAAMGGGMMESAFGPDTSNVLSGLTIKATVIFFVLSFFLYLGYVHVRGHGSNGGGALPNIAAPAKPVAAPKQATAPVAAPSATAPNAAKTSTPAGAPAKTP